MCDKVRAGEKIFHCNEWENLFGWNIVEPIYDHNRAASYITKYITKELGKLDAKTRIWHSRELKRAERVAQYHVPLATPYELAEYDATFHGLAAVTKQGRVLHDCNYIYTGKDKSVLTLVNIITRINSSDTPLENVLAYLNQNYEILESEIL